MTNTEKNSKDLISLRNVEDNSYYEAMEDFLKNKKLFNNFYDEYVKSESHIEEEERRLRELMDRYGLDEEMLGIRLRGEI